VRCRRHALSRVRSRRADVADLVVIVGVLAFFAVCVWFTWACDRIIGPDEDVIDRRDDEAGRETAEAHA
jgi:hypothetical protein